MGAMGVIPISELDRTLQAHINALINEIHASNLTKETKHVRAASDQLRRFIAANFVAKGVE